MASRRTTQELRLLDEPTTKQLDLLEVIFAFRWGDSLITDVYQVMKYLSALTADQSSDDAAKMAMHRFLDIFAGSTIKVPSADQVRQCVRDVAIYTTIKAQGETTEAIEAQATRYGLAQKTVSAIYADIKGVVALHRDVRRDMRKNGDKAHV